MWVIPAALVLVTIGGYFLARQSLAPVAQMASQARSIGAANLNNRLAVANPADELGQLALSFNELLDRLDKSFEQQKRFVADASHELRTPLAILTGEADVALSREDRPSGEYRDSLSILRDESRRLTRIVEDLFTLTRADAGQLPLRPEPLYLDELISDVLKQARSLASAKHLALESDLSPDLPIHADDSLLRRMFLNLIDNAIKYTPPGGKILVRCFKNATHFVIEVSDTGPGIPEDLQPKIFERFVRADQARTRSAGETSGAGLGLAIARWIAEAHNGELRLSKSGPQGSTFTVTLPISAHT